MPGAYWDKAKVSEALSDIESIRCRALIYFKEILNEFQGVNQSIEYYDMIAGSWLEHFVHVVYASALADADAAERENGTCSVPICINHDSFLNQLTDETFHISLGKNIRALQTRNAAINAWIFCPVKAAAKEPIAKTVRPAKIDRIVHRLKSDAKKIAQSAHQLSKRNFRIIERRPGSPAVLFVQPYFKAAPNDIDDVKNRWRHWARFDDLRYSIQVATVIDSRWRKEKASHALPAASIIDIVKVLLPLYIPIVLLEGLSEYRNTLFKLPVAMVRPKVLYSANALHNNLSFNLLAAEWCREGTRLFYHQHGGGYGIDQINIPEEVEVRVASRFFTWGWSRDEKKVSPLRPPMPHAPQRKRNVVLLNCVNYPKSVYRIQYQPMPGTIENMHRQTLDLLAQIKYLKNLLVRPYFNDYGWGFANAMRKAAPNADFDDRSVSSFVRFAQSRLVIHNYLGTSYLETLALNIPTICFYDDNIYCFRDAAIPYMDALEAVGILHRSGRSAANMVNDIARAPESWWQSSEVQSARQAFIENYANFSMEWKQEWPDFFHKMLGD
ncbi:LIC12162 family transferase [Thiorhodovibrio frisius]|uniref:Transferase, LIC12162 family n=1 Tax=Thiorhodovibrio frisius TaxID=631362 RepID=H8Z0A9_9GAMM|nr:LIC12162 family protein [Thiorhodovibrio frisius]EIC22317.1 hypothetical protein Thi970DRAFT_02570 [Thiorhodovibrio frisius]WPL24614.1 hypothetical protein Thiofri_04834 [Thiorhodovibrio frisius]